MPAVSFNNQSIQFELFLPRYILWKSLLILLIEDQTPHNQIIHFRAHKTGVRVLSRTNQRLAPDIERRINKHRTACFSLECADQIII